MAEQAGAVNGEARRDALTALERLAGCQRSCGEHRTEVDRRLTGLEGGTHEMSRQLMRLQTDFAVRKAELSTKATVTIALIAALGGAIPVILSHLLGAR